MVTRQFNEDNLFRRKSILIDELKPDFPINIIPLTVDEFLNSYKNDSIIIREAIMYGKVIHDGLGLFDRLVTK